MMSGQASLDQHPTTFSASSRSAGHLTQKLKTPLRRAKIRKIDSDVRIDDAHQCDVRKVESLGNRLRSEKNVDFSSGDAVEYSSVSPLSAGGIEVHSRNP